METLILLPEKITLLRTPKNQLYGDEAEYDIYYSNIIYPYKEEYDIQIKCQYGMNLGRCWRINNFNNVPDSFDWTLQIYAPYGELIAEKSCRFFVASPEARKPFKIMCLGDSITRGELYVEEMTHKALGATTVGIRRCEYNIKHEGRGGWTYHAYFNNFTDKGTSTSPFLFPKGIAGGDYYGDLQYMQHVKNDPYHYDYMGMYYDEIKDGMYCLKDGALCKFENGEYKLVDKNPQPEFSFEKYFERFGVEKPDIISLLFGANELQVCHYDTTMQEVEKYINNAKRMVDLILEQGIKVIINLPVTGADQYAWGTQLGCNTSAKNYEYNIKMGVKALLGEFDGREAEGIFICATNAVVDPIAGFSSEVSRASQYASEFIKHNNNWVHPDKPGHRQMGDILASTCVRMIEG